MLLLVELLRSLTSAFYSISIGLVIERHFVVYVHLYYVWYLLVTIELVHCSYSLLPLKLPCKHKPLQAHTHSYSTLPLHQSIAITICKRILLHTSHLRKCPHSIQFLKNFSRIPLWILLDRFLLLLLLLLLLVLLFSAFVVVLELRRCVWVR